MRATGLVWPAMFDDYVMMTMVGKFVDSISDDRPDNNDVALRLTPM